MPDVQHAMRIHSEMLKYRRSVSWIWLVFVRNRTLTGLQSFLRVVPESAGSSSAA